MMMNKRKQHGVMLIEALIAILIFSPIERLSNCFDVISSPVYWL